MISNLPLPARRWTGFTRLMEFFKMSASRKFAGLVLAGYLCSVGSATLAQEPAGGERSRGGFGDRGGFSGGFRGRGGPGGGPGGGGLLFEIQNEATRAELGVTDEQFQKLQQLQESSMSQMREFFSARGSAQTEEERNAVREEMQKRMEEIRQQSESQAKEILSVEQFTRLGQLRLHREGPRALGRDDLASEFGLTEEQRASLAQVLEERDTARRDLGRDASDEDRAAFDQAWNGKILAVLTPAQQSKWTERLGPPPAATGSTSRPSAPSVATPAVPERPRQIYIEPPPADAESVASFGRTAVATAAVPEPPATAPPGQPASLPEDGDKRLSFNFRFAPWADVLRLFAEEAGLSLDLQTVPPGTFNYLDNKRYSPAETLDILNGYLLPKGYCLIRRDDFLVCINIDQPIPPNLIPNVTPEQLDEFGNNQLLTVIFPLTGVAVDQMAAEINEIKGPQGKVAPLKSTNSVLVTDIGSNLKRIRALLSDVTARSGPNDQTFKAYPIRHVAASDVEGILKSLMGMSTGIVNVSAMNDSRSRDPRSAPPPPPAAGPTTPVQITTDPRTNQLLVTATLAQHLLIEQALKTIDVDAESTQFGPSSNRPYLQVYSTKSSDAREVVKTIDALMPGIVVNEDARNNKIHIQAKPDQHRQVELLIAQMDGTGGAQSMSVIPLSKLDAVSAMVTLRAMFQKDGDGAPTIEADSYGRQLMVRGSQDQILQIKGLLLELGESGTREAKGSNEARVRTIPLSGRDPEELVPLLERMWKASQPNSNIRVITPQQRTPLNNMPEGARPGTPSAERPTENRSLLRTASQTTEAADSPSAEESASQPAEATPSSREDELYRLLQEYADRPSTTQAPAAPSQPPAGAAPADARSADVSISIVGDELILSSSDPRQLDELEVLLERTLQAVPARITWTVFTLQSADATEAAAMLDLLFPNATVGSSSSASSGMIGSMSSSMSSLGSGLMEMTGLGSLGSSPQVLRIIPDIRLNALFVSGPTAQVREIEEMLRVLDASSLSDSYRDKYSRMIAIAHADAQEVYNTVREVYKVYLDEQQNNRRDNPIAQMFGGGGRSSREEQAKAPPAKLAIGVDTNTNHLIVWADESLFREIETLVQSIDKAAEDARRTVQVMPLQNTNSTVVQNALGSLMPRVKVSTTGTRTNRPEPSPSTSSPPSSSSGSSSSSDPSREERIRQFMEMRSRMGGDSGGSSRGGFGGPPSGFGGPPSSSSGGWRGGSSSGGSDRGSSRGR